MSNFGQKVGYKEREDDKFREWLNDIQNPKFPVYIISGDHFWKKETVDEMSVALGRRPDQVNENLKQYTDKMRYRSISRKKHFILFESKGKSLKDNDLHTLKEYFGDPSENGIIIIFLKDRSEKSYFLKNFKMIRRSQKIKFLEMDYVSDRFKENFVKRKLGSYDFEFENEKLYIDTVKNLILNLSELEDNLMTLSSLETPILSKEDIKNSIEEYSDNDLSKLYDSLTKLNRKKAPFEIVNELLSEGSQPIQILRGIKKYFNYLYQAKYLKLRGILRVNDIEEMKKDLYIDEGVIFKKYDIWELPKRNRNQYLQDCDEITLKEIILILNILESHTNRIRIREKDLSTELDKYSYREFVDKYILIKCLIEITNRRKEF